MKLKLRTRSEVKISRPEVSLTETEILADLNYPAPAVSDPDRHRAASATDGGR